MSIRTPSLALTPQTPSSYGHDDSDALIAWLCQRGYSPLRPTAEHERARLVRSQSLLIVYKRSLLLQGRDTVSAHTLLAQLVTTTQPALLHEVPGARYDLRADWTAAAGTAVPR